MSESDCQHLYGPGASGSPYAGKFTRCSEISPNCDLRHLSREGLREVFSAYLHDYEPGECAHVTVGEVVDEFLHRPVQ